MQLGLSSSLRRLVTAKFESALANKSLTLSETDLVVVRVAGLPFQLRYCPTLAQKPKKDVNHSASAKRVDPFDSPDPDLLVAEVPQQDPTHVIVLNKYPIIPRHFILATKLDKQQTQFLEEDDLAATYACLRDWSQPADAAGEQPRLFAFFNSGDHSGASQAHRHVQFLPIEDIRGGSAGEAWSLLADSIVSGPDNNEDGELSWFRSHRDLPFKHFASRIPRNSPPAVLHQVYHNLYDASERAVRDYIEYEPGSVELHPTDGGNLPISYNLAMTTTYMIMCPRQREGKAIRRGDGSEIDSVALNGTLLAGTLLVKNEELWQTIQEEPGRLEGVLEATCIPTTMARVRSRTNLAAMNNL